MRLKEHEINVERDPKFHKNKDQFFRDGGEKKMSVASSTKSKFS
jgi:hypothetical protein